MATTRPRRRLAALFAVGGALLITALPGLSPRTAGASSHREAPLISADPTVDNTDVYAFVSPDRPDTVTLVANFIPFEEPNGGPNFYPFATDAGYWFHIDNDGDAKADVVFRYTFKNIDKRGKSTFLYANGPVDSLDDDNLLFRQTYTLEYWYDNGKGGVLKRDAPVAPSFVGKATMPDYGKLRSQAITDLPGMGKSFAGQADDAFFLDLRVFDLLYGGDLSETGQDTVAGYNVNTLALQVPMNALALKGDAKRNPVIGVWSTTDRSRVQARGRSEYNDRDRVQTSRLGNPLVNEVVVPAALKDQFNASRPDQDAGNKDLVNRILEPELPKLLEAIYKIPAPPTPRNDLLEIFATGITTKAGGPIQADLNSQLNNADVNPKKFQPSEQLRLNMSVPVTGSPNRLGVLAGDLQGFPNGRRLTDDVVDIELQALVGAAQTGKLVDALAAGDKVDQNNVAFDNTFPYVAAPNTGAVNQTQAGGSGGGSSSGRGTTRPGEGEMPWKPIALATTAVGLSALAAMLFFIAAAWWRRRTAAATGEAPTQRFHLW